MATATLSVNIKQALGAALVEVLIGNLTDETIAAVKSIKSVDVPPSMRDLTHYIQGMSTSSIVREGCSRDVLVELSAAANDALQERMKS